MMTRFVPVTTSALRLDAKQRQTLNYARIAKRIAVIALSATALAACTVRPQPITQAQHFKRAADDYKELYASYVPVSGPLSLQDAIARALKYNYDAELAKTEVTLQEKQLDLAMTQMLPRLAANAGYDYRNNDNAAESVSELTHQQSLEYSYSQQPMDRNASLEFSWNLLDLGVSYFQAKQQGYRAFVAVERRRKVINGIVKGVQEAYWVASAADQLLPRLNSLLTEAHHVLDQSRQAETSNLQPALTALDFQNSMLQVIDQLEHMRSDLITAKVQLAALINVPIDTPLVLAGVPTVIPPPPSFIDHNKLETLGLALRPELREEAYQEKIDRQDVYKEMIKMMPGIGVLGDVNYDSNKYLYNSTWGGFGIQATYNLVSLIDGPKAISAAKSSVQVAHIRRLALSVAVLTQVNLSLQEYLAAQQDLDITKQIADVQGRIEVASQNEKTALDQPEAESIRRDLEQMAAEFAYDRSLAQVHTALADLYNAVGVDLVPPTVNTDDLNTLGAKVGTAISGWESGALPSEEVPASLQEISSASSR